MKKKHLYTYMLIWAGLLAGALLLFGGNTPTQAQTAEYDSYIYLPLTTKNYDPTWQWTSVFTPTLSPSPYRNPLMAIDRQGQVHLFWDTTVSVALHLIVV